MIRGLRNSLLPFVAVLSVAAVVAQGQSVLTHHVRDAVRSGQAQATGRLPSNQVLQLDLVLPLRDPAGLESFLKRALQSRQPLLPAVPHSAGVHRPVWSLPGRLRCGGSVREDLWV